MKYFLSVEELHENMDEYLIIDVQFVLGDASASFECFKKGHIEGATFLNLETEVSGEINEDTGRHPLPQVSDFLKLLEEKAISPKDKVVIYDNFGGAAAARVWWMLTTLGYPNVFVLDGGINAWKKKYPLSQSITSKPVISLDYSLFPSEWSEGLLPIVSHDEVTSIPVVIDSRNKERFLLQESGPDPVIGRIPGSVNLPWAENLAGDGSLISKEILYPKFQKLLEGKHSVFYCGSGVSACFNILIAKSLGFDTPALYPGSWSEWYKIYPTLIR